MNIKYINKYKDKLNIEFLSCNETLTPEIFEHINTNIKKWEWNAVFSVIKLTQNFIEKYSKYLDDDYLIMRNKTLTYDMMKYIKKLNPIYVSRDIKLFPQFAKDYKDKFNMGLFHEIQL